MTEIENGVYDADDRGLRRHAHGLVGLVRHCISKRSLRPAVARARQAIIIALVGERFVVMNAVSVGGVLRNRYQAAEAIVRGCAGLTITIEDRASGGRLPRLRIQPTPAACRGDREA